ncbi:hypothetical protein, conserved [Plasmodium gonderi]|uniref:Uncharacterized protein n=1 Tax=Plasmodium gonderi TaxID=77519 RepID=A0A1Y1JFV9_PLAGO|nr:hypothetical protein, conserved [Plasmodium gonderi]GAW80538.1 hypothetical protein, conserved [Plasmodium gonderi]
MSCIGKMDRCCCFPLAGGCIAAIMIHTGFCVSAIFSHTAEYRMLSIICNALLACLLIFGLVIKNFIIFYVVAVFVSFLVGTYIVAFVFIFISFFVRDGIPLEGKIFTAVIIFLMIFISAFFLNIYISMSKVLKAGGTGWEFKNYLELESEKPKEKKEVKKEEPRPNIDYKA